MCALGVCGLVPLQDALKLGCWCCWVPLQGASAAARCLWQSSVMVLQGAAPQRFFVMLASFFRERGPGCPTNEEYQVAGERSTDPGVFYSLTDGFCCFPFA